MPPQIGLTIPFAPPGAPPPDAPDFSLSSLTGGDAPEPQLAQQQAPAAGPPPDEELRDEDVVDMGVWTGPVPTFIPPSEGPQLPSPDKYPAAPPVGRMYPAGPAPGRSTTEVAEEALSGIGEALGGLWSTLNPAPILMELGRSTVEDWRHADAAAAKGNYTEAYQHLLKSLPLTKVVTEVGGGIAKAHWDALKKAQANYKQGNFFEAMGYAAAAVLPVAGPAAASTGQRLGSGEIGFARAFGEGAGQLIPFAKGKKLPRAAVVPVAEDAAAISQAEKVAAFADEHGLPMTPGQRMGNPFVKAAEQLNEYSSMVGAAIGLKKRAGRAAGVQRVGAALGEKVAPLESPESAGAKASQALNKVDRDIDMAFRKESEAIAAKEFPSARTPLQVGDDVFFHFKDKLEGLDAKADAAYETFRTLIDDPKYTQDVTVGWQEAKTSAHTVEKAYGQPVTRKIQMPVDLKGLGVKSELLEIYRKIVGDEEALGVPPHQATVRPDPNWTLPRKQASPAFAAVEQLVKGPDVVGVEYAERMLSAIKWVGREHGGISKVAQSKLQHAIDFTVKQAGPDVQSALNTGRASTRAYYAAAEVLADLKGEVVKGRNAAGANVVNVSGAASEVFGRVTGKHELLQKVAVEVPDAVPIIARGYLDDLFKPALDGGFDFSRVDGMLESWNSMEPATKALMFKNPNTLRQVSLFFEQARKVAKERVQTKALSNSNSAVGAFDALVLPHDTGFERLQAVGKVAPEVPLQIGRAWLEKALAKTGEKASDIQHGQQVFADWNRLGPKSKNAMFGAANVENLDTFFRYISDAAYNANPSRTAFVTAAGIKISSAINLDPRILYTEIGQGTVAALMWNPKFAKAMVTAMRTPRAARVASATAAARVLNMVRDSGLQKVMPASNVLAGERERDREDAAVVDMGTYQDPSAPIAGSVPAGAPDPPLPPGMQLPVSGPRSRIRAEVVNPAQGR